MEARTPEGGEAPVLRARTLLEASVYANLPAILAGTAEPYPDVEPEEGAEAWTLRYGTAEVAVEVNVPYADEAAARRSGQRFGAGRSRLIDAGQWRLLSAAYARATLAADLAFAEDPEDPENLEAPGDADDLDARYDDIVLGWQLARDAAVEVLKFIPPDGDDVPPDAFWTDTGAAARAAEPGRFTRAALAEDIDFYRQNLEDFRAMHA